MSIQRSLCEAINNHQIVQFYYEGHLRIVEPHLVREKTSGNICLSAWQVGGYSESDRQPPWRNYVLDNITQLALTNDKFSGSRPGYNPNDRTMSRIICRL